LILVGFSGSMGGISHGILRFFFCFFFPLLTSQLWQSSERSYRCHHWWPLAANTHSSHRNRTDRLASHFVATPHLATTTLLYPHPSHFTSTLTHLGLIESLVAIYKPWFVSVFNHDSSNVVFSFSRSRSEISSGQSNSIFKHLSPSPIAEGGCPVFSFASRTSHGGCHAEVKPAAGTSPREAGPSE